MYNQEPADIRVTLVILALALLALFALAKCQPTDAECNRRCYERGASGWSRDPRTFGCVCGFEVKPVNP